MNLEENGDGGSVAKIRLVLDSGFNAVHPNTTILYLTIKIVVMRKNKVVGIMNTKLYLFLLLKI